MNFPLLKRFSIFISLIIIFPFFVEAQVPECLSFPPFAADAKADKWVDSVLKSLNVDDRIGQLIMADVQPTKEKWYLDGVASLVQSYHIGGLIFFKGGPVKQAQLTNYYQSIARLPLMIGIDGEWGLAMRLDSTMKFPHEMTLGAARDDSLVYKMGEQVARECKRLGIHVNFAPVVDVNDNPLNPVISNRSFGEEKKEVAERGYLYMKALQDHGILATAKHFPGHGNTDRDSHLSLPLISRSRSVLDTLELYPFESLIGRGLGGMMIAHLFVPALDATPNMPTTLSGKVVTDLLRNEMCFNGLIFTDAMMMRGVTGVAEPGERELKALIAGNDILLFPEDVPRAISAIRNGILSGRITQAEVDEHVKRVLRVKYWQGLNHYTPIELKNLVEDLNTAKANVLNGQLFDSCITVLSNKDNLIPLQGLDTTRIAVLVSGVDSTTVFEQYLGYYAPVDVFHLSKKTIGNWMADTLLKTLSTYNVIIVSVQGTLISADQNYGIDARVNNYIDELSKDHKVILDIFGNAYCLTRLPSATKADAVILSYEDSNPVGRTSAGLIFGAKGASGRIPVTPVSAFPRGTGILIKPTGKLQFALPEAVGMDSKKLSKIDSLAKNGIAAGAMPGCQVFVAKDGKVIFHKSYGYHTYDKKEPVKETDLYDLASVTKIAATTMALMKLVDEKKINLDKKISDYLPELKTTNKKDIILREMLCHQAGLVPWIPFYKSTITDGHLNDSIYKNTKMPGYTLQVAEKLYMKDSYADTIWKTIKESPLSGAGRFIYSDLTMMITKRIVEQESGQPLDSFVYKNFYSKMGLETMCFKPRDRFPANRIAPTENDLTWRGQLLVGYVHDQAAAMLGGVSGHAGLFCDAFDLTALMQMMLQHGVYGGVRYIDSATVADFTKQQYPLNFNRRGIGFDKPDIQNNRNGSVIKAASAETYGHTGFTGNVVWTDPKYNLTYVFLSNRCNPVAENPKLVNMNIRTDIQQVIYDSMNLEKR